MGKKYGMPKKKPVTSKAKKAKKNASKSSKKKTR